MARLSASLGGRSHFSGSRSRVAGFCLVAGINLVQTVAQIPATVQDGYGMLKAGTIIWKLLKSFSSGWIFMLAVCAEKSCALLRATFSTYFV